MEQNYLSGIGETMLKKSLQNIKLVIAYEGTRYQGWQRLGKKQNDKSIQGILEEVITSLVGMEVKVIGSGRTDAGVHATGQVANCYLPKQYEITSFQAEVNQRLPKDIQIVEVIKVATNFHSRYDATGKVYEYKMDVRETANVFTRTTRLHVPQPLDVARMRQAATFLLGTHDFAGYASAMPDGRGTVKTITSIEFFEEDGEVSIRFIGDGFLYHMIRIIVGTLLEVGMGKRTVASVSVPLQTKKRADAGPTVSGVGLHLLTVEY